MPLRPKYRAGSKAPSDAGSLGSRLFRDIINVFKLSAVHKNIPPGSDWTAAAPGASLVARPQSVFIPQGHAGARSRVRARM